MMLPFMDSIRGASFTARIPVGTRSQDKANFLCIDKGSDGKALFRTVTGRLDQSYNVDMKCIKASLAFGTGPCQSNCLSKAFVADPVAAPSSTHTGMPKRLKRCAFWSWSRADDRLIASPSPTTRVYGGTLVVWPGMPFPNQW